MCQRTAYHCSAASASCAEMRCQPAGEAAPWSEEAAALTRSAAASLGEALRRGRAAAPARRPGGRVACVMMQRDEDVLLDPWIAYHAALFGAENLFVLDNGSSLPPVRDRLRRAAEQGVNVVWDLGAKELFEKKGRLFCDLLRQAIEPNHEHDFFMPLDCDEFVAALEPDGRVDCTAGGIARALAPHLDDPRLLTIAGSFFNLPGQPGAYFFNNERKCFFARGAAGFLHMGFHDGGSRLSQGQAATRIGHFHYRFKPHALYLRSARHKLEERVPIFDREAVAASPRTRDTHVARYAFLGEGEYRAAFAGRQDRIPINSLEVALGRLGLDLPY